MFKWAIFIIMYKIWTPEEDNELISLKQQGIARKDIALKLNRTKDSVDSRCKYLIKSGYLESNLWKPEEIEKLLELRSTGVENTEIAEILGRSLSSTTMKIKRLIKEGTLQSRNTRSQYINLKDEEILQKIKEYVSYKQAPADFPHIVQVRFGSWSNAQTLAGVNGRIGGVTDPNLTTKLYLLKFNKFYKVGITQQTIKQRFAGAPSYEVLDCLETDLDNAYYLEKAVLKHVRPYQYIAEELEVKGGKTECFIPPHPINALEEIFDL